MLDYWLRMALGAFFLVGVILPVARAPAAALRAHHPREGMAHAGRRRRSAGSRLATGTATAPILFRYEFLFCRRWCYCGLRECRASVNEIPMFIFPMNRSACASVASKRTARGESALLFGLVNRQVELARKDYDRWNVPDVF